MKKIFLFIMIVCAFTACDLERFPYDKYTQEQVEDDLEILLTGCYSCLKSWSNNMHFVGEFGGDNVMKQATSTDPWFEFISYDHTPTNARMTSFWTDSYKVISQASDIIRLANEGNYGEVDQLVGEAYCLRGMMYLYLCRTFGRPYYQSPQTNLGVPLVNGLPEDMSNLVLPDRATVKETYEQAIADLEKAESLLASERRSIYASKEVAQALLSRIYLYMSGTYENPETDYADESIRYADLVIHSGNYELLARENFLKYNELEPDAPSQTETIFAVKRVLSEFTSSDLFGSIGGMYSTIYGVGWGEVYASGDYLDLLYEVEDKKDARWAFISPEYAEEEEEVFRYIVAQRNEQGEVTGYNYRQDVITGSAGNYAVTIDGVNYPLTLVKEADRTYTIHYTGTVYTGHIDQRMVESNGYPQFFVIKCSMQGGESQLHSPIVIRLAEMYLNKAEAYVKKGDYARALEALNKVRGRAITGGEYESLTAENAVERIVKERRLELAFEAHRTVDIYRLGHTLKRPYPGIHNQLLEVPATANRVIQYIPLDEINAYPGTLTQNP
ncbi:MAG: RagB/SusD family nutrient uptake outer membrane protein [Tannerellaceae bacterium]|nr:RagB/SusD family nutrient uptake outer membrane protein [Tannerellaceae bacterium]